MKKGTLAQKLRIDEAGLERIRAEVVRQESRTTGEIALAAVAESSDYSFSELLFSVMAGALAFAVLLPFHGAVQDLLDRLFWIAETWMLPAFYGAARFAVIALVFLVSNIDALDRLIVPRKVRSQEVYRRALRHFTESGVYATAERTGILVFVSLMEREVRVIADSGISDKIGQEDWNAIAASVASGIKAGKTAEALEEAVARCGDLLAKHFPAREKNPNELADGLVFPEEA